MGGNQYSQAHGGYSENSRPSSANYSSSGTRPDSPGQFSFPEIEGLSEQRIKQLLEDPQAFQDFFRETQCVKNLSAARDEVRKKNQERAQRNLEREALLAEERQRLDQISMELADLKKEYEELSMQQADLMKEYTPSVLRAKLAQGVDEAEERSEQVVEEFGDGQLSLEQFVERYVAERKVYHLRKAKMECIG